MQDDYSFGREHRARATELQDIAAMDRLAAEAASAPPTSPLRSIVPAPERTLERWLVAPADRSYAKTPS